jgi:hypothetical protein
MLSPDAVLCLDPPAPCSMNPGSTLYFFKNHQFACWDVATDVMLPGFPRDIPSQWPGVLESFPGTRLRGALHVPEWGKKIYFFFEGRSEVVVWDLALQTVDPLESARNALLPSVMEGDVTTVYARVANGERVVYGFQGLDYTRWTVHSGFPSAEDPGFPRKIADDWKDGLVLAPRSAVYVDWPNRSSAHSNQKIYFFMGDLYLRWDVPSNSRNYRLDILAGWKNWPAFA